MPGRKYLAHRGMKKRMSEFVTGLFSVADEVDVLKGGIKDA